MKINIYQKLFFIIFCSSLLLAQSDFRITQEFKSRHRSFEIAIEYAKTIDELDKISKEINEFKNEFKGNKELLNRALYPSNFEQSFTVLNKKIEYTNKKLTQITTLQTKVTQVESNYTKLSTELQKLSSEVNGLRRTNSRLMSELKAFKSGYGGSKESIDSLNNLVAQLKSGISKRDTLIKEILDNVFMTAEHKIESLDDAEKLNIRTEIEGTSLIDNINNLINDNIEFLDASIFTSNDLSALQTEFSDFEQRWSHFGPKLFSIYSTDKQNQDKLADIDTLIVAWNNSLNSSIWKSISTVFSSNNIDLDNFKTGDEFERVIVDYILLKTNNSGSITELENEQQYVFFAERSWSDVFKPEWMPLLISSDLLTSEQISNIELKLADWKDNTSGSKSYFIYAIIAILALMIIVSVTMINKRNKNKEHELESGVEVAINKDANNKNINEDDQFIDDEKEKE